MLRQLSARPYEIKAIIELKKPVVETIEPIRQLFMQISLSHHSCSDLSLHNIITLKNYPITSAAMLITCTV